MTDKPILSIDIDDGQFQKFAELFNKYQAAAKDNSAWESVGKTAQATAGEFEKIERSMRKTAEAKTRRKQEKEADGLAKIQFAWASIAVNSRKFYHHIHDATLSLMKWGGLTSLFSSIVGAGGLFGITRMAMGVSSRRMSAAGLGVGYGQQRAFNTSLGRLGNTDALLGGFQHALTDVNARGALMSIMGANAAQRLAGKNAVGAAQEALPDIQRLLKRSPATSLMQTVEAYHLQELGISPEMAVLLRNMSPEELRDVVERSKSLTERLDLSPKLQRDFRNFVDQLERAETTVVTHFERSLGRIAPGVGKVARAIEELFQVFLGKGSPIGDWIGRINEGLKSFAHNVEQYPIETWLKDMSNAMGSVERLAASIGASDPTHGAFGQAPMSAGQAKANRWVNALGRWVTGRDQISKGQRNLFNAARRGHGMMPADKLDAILPKITELNKNENLSENQLAARIKQISPDLSSRQCVALAKAAVGSNESVRSWRRGVNLFSQPIPRGTPIATFMDRRGRPSTRYDAGGVGAPGNNTTHAAVFDSYVRDADGNVVGMKVWEQYAGRGGAPHMKTYHIGDPRGGEKDARNYFTINGPTGGPLGRHNPMSNPKLQGGGNHHTQVENSDASTSVQVKTSPYGALSRLGLDAPQPNFPPTWRVAH